MILYANFQAVQGPSERFNWYHDMVEVHDTLEVQILLEHYFYDCIRAKSAMRFCVWPNSGNFQSEKWK